VATTDELLDQLMKNYKKPEDLIGESGLLKQLTKALVERAMEHSGTLMLLVHNFHPAVSNLIITSLPASIIHSAP
jgi:putative transposase